MKINFKFLSFNEYCTLNIFNQIQDVLFIQNKINIDKQHLQLNIFKQKEYKKTEEYTYYCL